MVLSKHENINNHLGVRSVKPVVTTDWVKRNRTAQNLVIIDIRCCEDYEAGHIPGSIDAPFTLWAIEKNGLTLELPEEDDLFNLIGECGISGNSTVVVVNSGQTMFCRADAARTAATLHYCGIENVAILDGGYETWLMEVGETTRETVKHPKISFSGTVKKEMFIDHDYVVKKMGEALIADARDPEVYSGLSEEPFTTRPGHIPCAVNLPALWIFSEEGTYRKAEELETITADVLGKDKASEIILYCGVGGYAATWWFVLTQILGYKNVKIYDGSAEEWTHIPELPMECDI